jgi:SHS2 domain-containing protein
MKRFEIIEHTADTGLRVFGSTLEALFENAGLGLMTALVQDLDTMTPTSSTEVTLEAPDDADLLVDWLNDRLFRFDAREEIHAWATVERVEDGRLVASSGYRKVDWEQDQFHAEIKSATYHGLRLERQGDLWVAEVIFDL